MRKYRNPLSTILRSKYWMERTLPHEILAASKIPAALGHIQHRWPEDETVSANNSDTPIFILSAGWGSGSTLLQRLIVSKETCILWGEPIDHAASIHRLARTLIPISEKWPHDDYFIKPEAEKELSNEWIANLTPPISYFRHAHRSFLEEWLKRPAVDLGYTYWGLKEVRLSIDHARYLKWLFPSAKFIFVYRDVMDSYLSCKNVDWFSVWPDYRVSSVSYFAHHWRYLLEGFLNGYKDVGGLMIKYEDLVNGQCSPEKIADYVGVGEFRADVLSKRVGSRKKDNRRVSAAEKFTINSITQELRNELGYS